MLAIVCTSRAARLRGPARPGLDAAGPSLPRRFPPPPLSAAAGLLQVPWPAGLGSGCRRRQRRLASRHSAGRCGAVRPCYGPSVPRISAAPSVSRGTMKGRDSEARVRLLRGPRRWVLSRSGPSVPRTSEAPPSRAHAGPLSRRSRRRPPAPRYGPHRHHRRLRRVSAAPTLASNTAPRSPALAGRAPGLSGQHIHGPHFQTCCGLSGQHIHRPHLRSLLGSEKLRPRVIWRLRGA